MRTLQLLLQDMIHDVRAGGAVQQASHHKGQLHVLHLMCAHAHSILRCFPLHNTLNTCSPELREISRDRPQAQPFPARKVMHVHRGAAFGKCQAPLSPDPAQDLIQDT